MINMNIYYTTKKEERYQINKVQSKRVGNFHKMMNMTYFQHVHDTGLKEKNQLTEQKH